MRENNTKEERKCKTKERRKRIKMKEKRSIKARRTCKVSLLKKIANKRMKA